MEEMTEEAAVKETPRDHASVSELSKKIEEAIQKLPHQQKLVFTMKAYEEMKLAEIGEILHLRLGTVKAHFFDATQKIQRALNGYV